jgi:hypothetical protein
LIANGVAPAPEESDQSEVSSLEIVEGPIASTAPEEQTASPKSVEKDEESRRVELELDRMRVRIIFDVVTGQVLS